MFSSDSSDWWMCFSCSKRTQTQDEKTKSKFCWRKRQMTQQEQKKQAMEKLKHMETRQEPGKYSKHRKTHEANLWQVKQIRKNTKMGSKALHVRKTETSKTETPNPDRNPPWRDHLLMPLKHIPRKVKFKPGVWRGVLNKIRHGMACKVANQRLEAHWTASFFLLISKSSFARSPAGCHSAKPACFYLLKSVRSCLVLGVCGCELEPWAIQYTGDLVCF